jgi:hypothetical protein
MTFARAEDPRERLLEKNGSSFGMVFVAFAFMAFTWARSTTFASCGTPSLISSITKVRARRSA